MTQVRDNPVTGKRIIVAPVRHLRPDSPHPAKAPGTAPETCPFCPGHEDALIGITLEIPGAAPGKWMTRVVGNKFPIVTGDDGYHEVIIEGPYHHGTLASHAPDMLAAVLETWRQRVAAAWASDDVRSVQLFRNDGATAGASISHPHTQLVALSAVPPEQRRREESWRRHAAESGDLPLCTMIAEERRRGEGILADDGAFLTFVPWAAEAAYEQWIAPFDADTPFAALGSDAIGALVAHVGAAARRQRAVLGTVPFNMLLVEPSRPVRDEMAGAWCLRFLPRTAPLAGLELNAGLAVNPSLPEADAAALRVAVDGPA